MRNHFYTLIISAFVLTLLGFRLVSVTNEKSEIFTIYLVRHAEKDLSSGTHGNPPLTSCGEERARQLSSFLIDVEIEAVYSTDYTRTMTTANPTANAKNLLIEEYDAQELEALAVLLLEREQNALVVGHSNTTGVLAGLLAGKEIGEIDLNVYNLIYQVNVHQGTSQLNQFQTSFTCEE